MKQEQRRTVSEWVDDHLIGVVSVALVVFITLLCCWAIHIQNANYREAYPVWVKQTGNPNKLTFEEWRSLMQVYNDHSITPMPQ